MPQSHRTGHNGKLVGPDSNRPLRRSRPMTNAHTISHTIFGERRLTLKGCTRSHVVADFRAVLPAFRYTHVRRAEVICTTQSRDNPLNPSMSSLKVAESRSMEKS